MYYSLQQL